MVWKDSLQNKLSTALGGEVVITNYSYVGGGSINETFRITTNLGEYFVKKNSAIRFPEMFEKEAKGITILSESNEIKVPRIVGVGAGSGESFLILNYINSGVESKQFWTKFGTQLANLHKHTSNSFGLSHDNYIGSLVQSNNNHESWNDFFREERLIPQIRMARNSGIMNVSDSKFFDGFFNELPNIFPNEKPSLLHGDLWSGNYMISENGDPVIIDPAVYYGHREMDLGMTQLFGGFNSSFYSSYNDRFPLEVGWRDRIELCNLYPLMVHVNLFGGGYMQSVRSIIRKF